MADPTSDTVRADAIIVRLNPTSGVASAPTTLNNVPAWVDTVRGVAVVRVRSGEETIDMPLVQFTDLNPMHPITTQLRAVKMNRTHMIQMGIGAVILTGIGVAIGRATKD